MAWNVPDHCSAARERQQQDAARIGAVHDQMRHPMRERVGLARARAGNDQQRRVTVVLHRRALFRIQPGKIGGGVGDLGVGRLGSGFRGKFR